MSNVSVAAVGHQRTSTCGYARALDVGVPGREVTLGGSPSGVYGPSAESIRACADDGHAWAPAPTCVLTGCLTSEYAVRPGRLPKSGHDARSRLSFFSPEGILSLMLCLGLDEYRYIPRY